MSTTLAGQIVEAITSTFTQLGQAILGLLKNGFVWLFTEYTETNGVYTITGISAFGYFVFILMGQKKGSVIWEHIIINTPLIAGKSLEDNQQPRHELIFM